MPVNLDTLQGDQEIYGSDGERIGIVGGIWTDPATGMRYLQVDRGVFLDLIGDALYVPEDALEQAELGKPVILKVSKQDAEARYVYRPDDLR
jgi:hypothetical protein